MFLNRLNEITKPKVHECKIDLGFGDGEETIYFRGLTFQERQDIFGARAKDDGTLDVRDKGRYLGAELVSAALCKADGKQVATVEAVRSWDAALLDRLASKAMEVLNAAAQGSGSDPSTSQETT